MSGAGNSFRLNDGDWTCAECSNVNFARRSQCNRCGTERKYDVKKIKKEGIEIGKQAAEKSQGLFSADDWMCKTCGNVNWARRGDCNMCNTPKVNIQEERTGLGGGFNERAGVEYKEKEDSDGEFDDFGRRKKKYRGKLSAPGVVKTSNVVTEEDEEESGDDEDVSKYDLDADDDEDDDDDFAKYDLTASEDEGKTKSEKSKSRSRSTSWGKSRDQKDGRHSSSSSSRSRSNSRSRRRRRSGTKSHSSTSSSGDSRGHRRHGQNKRQSRSRSRSPHHRHRRSSSQDWHNRRH